jgi:hypothetical protein
MASSTATATYAATCALLRWPAPPMAAKVGGHDGPACDERYDVANG